MKKTGQLSNHPTSSELEPLGITKKESFNAQQTASIPEKKFNEILDEGVRVTQEALLREARLQHSIENRPLAPLPWHKYRTSVLASRLSKLPLCARDFIRAFW